MTSMNFGPEWMRKMSQSSLPNPSEATPPDSPYSQNFNTSSYSAVASGGQNSSANGSDMKADKSPNTQQNLLDQLEPFKYSKDFILSLYRPSEIPPDFEASPLVTNEIALEPISFLPLTDIEKEVLESASVNSEVKRRPHSTPYREKPFYRNTGHSSEKHQNNIKGREGGYGRGFKKYGRDEEGREASPHTSNRFHRSTDNASGIQQGGTSDLWALPNEDAVGSFDSKGVFRLSSEANAQLETSEPFRSIPLDPISSDITKTKDYSEMKHQYVENSTIEFQDPKNQHLRNSELQSGRSPVSLHLPDTYDPLQGVVHQRSSLRPIPRWWYRDPIGNVQGPFTSMEMQDWYEANYFPMSLHIKPEGSNQFYTLSSWIHLCGDEHHPFLILIPQPEVEPMVPSGQPPLFSDDHHRNQDPNLDYRMPYEVPVGDSQPFRHQYPSLGPKQENTMVWGNTSRTLFDTFSKNPNPLSAYGATSGTAHYSLNQRELPFSSVFGSGHPHYTAEQLLHSEQAALHYDLGQLSLHARDDERQKMLNVLQNKQFDTKMQHEPDFQPRYEAEFGAYAETAPQWQTTSMENKRDPYWQVKDNQVQQHNIEQPTLPPEEIVQNENVNISTPHKKPWGKPLVDTSSRSTIIPNKEIVVEKKAPSPISVIQEEEEQSPVIEEEKQPAIQKRQKKVTPEAPEPSVEEKSPTESDLKTAKSPNSGSSGAGWGKVIEPQQTSLREIQKLEMQNNTSVSSKSGKGNVKVSTSGTIINSSSSGLKSPPKFGPAWQTVKTTPSKKTVLEIQKEEEELAKVKAAAANAKVVSNVGKTWSDTVANASGSIPGSSTGVWSAAKPITQSSKIGVPRPDSWTETSDARKKISINPNAPALTPSQMKTSAKTSTSPSVVSPPISQSGINKGTVLNNTGKFMPSEDFMKWCRTSLKFVTGINTDDFIQMLLTFPPDQSVTVVEIIQETVSSTEGPKFANEFIHRWFKELGISNEPLSATSPTIKTSPIAQDNSNVGNNSNGGFKVVKSKKRGKKQES